MYIRDEAHHQPKQKNYIRVHIPIHRMSQLHRHIGDSEFYGSSLTFPSGFLSLWPGLICNWKRLDDPLSSDNLNIVFVIHR